MTSCDRVREELTALSLGELEPGAAAVARAHLAGCAGCARVALRDRELVAVLRGAAEPAPPRVRPKVVTAVRAEAGRLAVVARRRKRRRWFAGAVAGLAAAALVAAIIVPRITAPAPGTPNTLALAWGAYEREQPIHLVRLTAGTDRQLADQLGPAARVPDLSGQGFWSPASGSRVFGGRLVAIAEYRDRQGAWLDLVRWRGPLQPPDGLASGAGPYGGWAQWGGSGAVWWAHNGVVYCLMGQAGHPRLDRLAERIQDA